MISKAICSVIALTLSSFAPASSAPRTKKRTHKAAIRAKQTTKKSETPQDRQSGTVEPLPFSYADKVTETWNPKAFDGKGHMIYVVETMLPFGYIPIDGLGDLLVDRSVNLPVADDRCYRLRIGQMFDIQASRDGHQILLKVGYMDDAFSGYGLYPWNRQKREPIVYEENIGSVFPKLYPSPDNRYIAYYKYLGYSFNNGVEQAPAIYDTRDQKSYLLKDFLAGGIDGWTKRNTFLYIGSNTRHARAESSKDSALYEMTVDPSKSSHFITDNAYGPVAESPNGRWIAFGGWQSSTDSTERLEVSDFDTTGAADAPSKAVGNHHGVCLFDRETKKRYFSFSEKNFSSLHWSPNGRKLIGIAGATFYDIDLPARSIRSLANLLAPSVSGSVAASNYPDFELLAFSHDNSKILAKSAQWQEYTDVQAIDIKTGGTTLIARIKNAHGVAWVSEP